MSSQASHELSQVTSPLQLDPWEKIGLSWQRVGLIHTQTKPT